MIQHTHTHTHYLHTGKKRFLVLFSFTFADIMAAEKFPAATLPGPNSHTDEENKDEKAFGNIFAELESVDLPLGTSLRYASTLYI